MMVSAEIEREVVSALSMLTDIFDHKIAGCALPRADTLGAVS
jgi:hypothetical protein